MASSFSSSKSRVYDVFLSFRGDDTRKTFTDHLYVALVNAGFRTFRDDEELRKGEEISASLMGAIQGSRISLIVFSHGFADSTWCLREVLQIMECKDTKGQLVFPIFYHVDPSDVRKQTGTYGDAFQKHEAGEVVSRDRIFMWRTALQKAANLSGWHIIKTHGSEAENIRNIVDDISGRLNNISLHVAVYPVGIDSRVEEISNSLSVGLHDVRMVGIWGMGGSGKTSLAKAIFNKFYHGFEGKSFLANVRETANQSNGMINLQERLLSDILKPTKVEVGDADRGIIVIQQRLESKKVLVIVDDVHELDQLYALAIRHKSFGPGSRIIITTRNRHLLEIIKVDAIHLTREMKEGEALELFSWHAFQNRYPDAEFLEVSTKICTYCGGLPLAIEVLGSLLFQSTVSQCEDTLHKLEECPNDKIQKILKISFDALDRNQKVIFLHISCFFIGMDKNYVKKILEGCGLFAEKDISVLLQRCLVIVSEKNKLMMHDLLRDMGREVVRAESYEDPNERSRLWCQKEVINVLTEESGTKKIEGLALNLQRSDKKSFRTEAFTKMQKLKLLQLNYVTLNGDYNHLSKNLSWLCWHGFSLKFIGNDFLYQGNLVSMDLRYSSLVQVWEHPGLLEKLKILNLSHSHYLTQSPDLSKLPNLEYFHMKDCRSLSEIHPSIGDVKRLAVVNLKDCQKLKDLPTSFYKLKFMETLVLSGCSRFENLVEDIGDMTSLTTLAVSGTAISQVPSYIGRLKNLNFSSVQGLVLLKQLFPEVPKNYFPTQDYTSLRYVNMDSTLPKFSGLSFLERPCFNNCTNLPARGDLPTRSKELELDHCTALEIIPKFSKVLRQSILQGRTASGDGGMCLPANDFPGWFTYVSESDQVFLQVPQIVGCNLKAFTVCVVCSSCFNEDKSPSGISILVTNYTKLTKEALLVMEFCDKSLVNVLDSRGAGFFDEKQVLSIFRDVCTAVFAMHTQSPPIAHRDLKAENLLLGPDGIWKLCDFGSTSTNHKRLEKPEEMGIEEDNIRKHTTPAYRAPEMWDLFRRELINEKVDIWALGCLLFRICYFKSAFDGESKLQILNGNYRIPELPKYSSSLTDLIRDMLQASPDDRPDITQVWFRVNEQLPVGLQKSLPDMQPEMHSAGKHEGFSRPANKSPDMPHRSPPPPPSAGESARNPSQPSNMSKAGGGGGPLGAFWSTHHYEDSLVVEEKTVPKFDESTSHSTSKHDRTHLDNHPFPKNSAPAKVENTPTYAARRNSHVKSQKYENGFPKDVEVSFFQKDTDHGVEGPKVSKPESATSFQDDAFNSFVTEFDTNKLSLGASNSKSGKEEALETEVERLKEQLRQANLQKAEITSKFEKLTSKFKKLSATCRSQRQELQELKQTLAARTPSPNKDALRNATSPGVQTSATPPQREKIDGTIWELQQDKSDWKTPSPETKSWQAFAEPLQPTSTENTVKSVRTRNGHRSKQAITQVNTGFDSWCFGTESFSAAPTGSTQISRRIGEGNISQRFGDARGFGEGNISQPAGWVSF